MSRIENIKLRNITEELLPTDVFAIYRDKTWIPVKGMRFDDLIFGDPTVLNANFQVTGTFTSAGIIRGQIDTSTTEALDLTAYSTVRQTASGITTAFTGMVKGTEVSVVNVSNGNNVITGTINGEVNPTIYCGEAFSMQFNGVDWDLI